MAVTIHPMSVRLVMVLCVIDKRLRRAMTTDGHNGKKHENDLGKQPHTLILHGSITLGKFTGKQVFSVPLTPFRVRLS